MVLYRYETLMMNMIVDHPPSIYHNMINMISVQPLKVHFMHAYWTLCSNIFQYTYCNDQLELGNEVKFDVILENLVNKLLNNFLHFYSFSFIFGLVSSLVMLNRCQ